MWANGRLVPIADERQFNGRLRQCRQLEGKGIVVDEIDRDYAGQRTATTRTTR